MSIIIIALLAITEIVPSESVSPDTQTVKIGLALSGGAALGLAHIGVLKVLEREGIPICCISGNSMGSMVGGVYAAGYSATEIESIAVNADWARLFSSSVPFGAQYLPERQQNERYVFQMRHKNFFPSLPSGIVPLQNVEFLLMKLLSEIEYNTFYDFDSLPIPYRAVAVDLITGNLLIMKKGRLEQAIRASIAIPGVFAPELIDNMELVDGGVKQYLPVEPIFELQPDFIIAVLTTKKNEETGISLIDVISRTMDIVSSEDLAQQRDYVDVLIEPDVDPFRHSDFPRVRELIAAGEVAAEAVLPDIRAKLEGYGLVQPHKKLSSRPLPIVHSVRVEGLQVTQESMILQGLRKHIGKVLNFSYLIDDLIDIFNTGLFEDINYRLEFCYEDSVDIVIELKERDYGFYAFGIYYDNVNNIVLGLEVGQGNLGGSGASIRAAINIGNPNEYRLGLTGTRLFTLPFGYRLDGFWNSIDRSYYEENQWQGDYNIDQRGGIMCMGYILGRNAFFNIGMTGYQVLYRLPPLSVFDSIPNREWIVGPEFSLKFNNFDNLFMPTKGLSYNLCLIYSCDKLKATNEFLKLSFNLDQITPLSSKVLIHPGVDLGISFGKLSWSDYFYTGGNNFIGFHQEEFTTGHKATCRLGIDFKLFDLFNQNKYPLYLQLFSNVAYLKRLDKLFDTQNFSAESLHVGIGAGLRTKTPLGPCQLIFGIGDFHKDPFSENVRYTLFVSVGRDFRYIQ